MNDQKKTDKLRARVLNALHLAGYDALYAVACALREHNIEIKTRDLIDPPHFTLAKEGEDSLIARIKKHLPTPHPVSCTLCNGTGHVENNGKLATCPACSGLKTAWGQGRDGLD